MKFLSAQNRVLRTKWRNNIFGYVHVVSSNLPIPVNTFFK